MEKVVNELEAAGITVKRFTCDYMAIIYMPLPRLSNYETIVKMYLILNKFHGFELIPPFPGEVKYFRTIGELIEYVKK